ncbi:N-acetyltransferase B complex non catalytic subunit-domain-containing protein [Exophiala viscosa]|uniref:N-acetyltransferase B complex non catalytic subunit-domain-containing protein n=1 Tax=Exophiala viscosa TaxID=2486360 RepID=A0AAN6E0F9_9EURO|nr:N-acetyltransferase B complex non catalytic subunit-domain-containing protein [Exophiala viscosa]KAI1621616.1 N-acetyltransferase B complex non catalytic subunit-domain-containing protein [Exophiala viscosa]
MSDPSVTERRIRPIQDAVATANWKQALQLCDKWSKKGEKSDRFLALKAFVQVNHPEKAQHDRGHTEVLDLCKRNPPITDPDAIYQMQDALKSLSLREVEGPKLWERAVTVKQNDKDLYIRWLNQAIADNNWLSAQKATMGLRKSFPKDRNYEFWNIMMCYLIHMQEGLPEKDRTLFGTLAYRMISKSAETIPAGQDELLAPGKAISTPEEVALLVQVLNSTGHPEESVKLLQGTLLNMESRVGRQDPQLIVSLLLQSFYASKQWDEAFTACQTLLSRFQADDQIWKLWLKAQSESRADSKREQAQALLNSVCSVKPTIRAAQMAKMNWLHTQGDSSSDALLQTCEDYASAFSNKAFCYDDLKASLRQLDKDRLDKFTKTQSEAPESFGHLFNLKMSYGFTPADMPTEDFTSFILQALEVFEKSTSTTSPCPEAAILAILAILRLSPTKDSPQNTLFAVILLQIARAKFEDYYLFSIFLILLQANLGLLSLAMQTFTRLSVKNMQYETVAHLILTRISSLHPAATSGNGNSSLAFEPSSAIDTGLTIIENADTALVRGIREGLRFNSYSNIYNSVKMRSDIERSMNRQILAIEERKLARLLGVSEETVLPVALSPLVDKRDYTYLPAYREDDAELVAQYRCGPLPKEKWINAMALFDNVATYLKAEFTGQPVLSAKAYENLLELQNRVDATDFFDGLEAELTKAELGTFECHKALAQVTLLLKDGNSENISASLDKIKTWASTSLDDHKTRTSGSIVVGDVRMPTWDDLHTSLSQLETLQVVATLLGILSKKSSGKSSKTKTSAATVDKQVLSELQDLVVALETQIHDDARVLKAEVNAPGVLGKLVDWGFGREEPFTKLEGVLEKLCDGVTMETICGGLKESWEDALDGVLAIKVKVYK